LFRVVYGVHKIPYASRVRVFCWNLPVASIVNCRSPFSTELSIHQVNPSQAMKWFQNIHETWQCKNKWCTCSVLIWHRGNKAWFGWSKFLRCKRLLVGTLSYKTNHINILILRGAILFHSKFVNENEPGNSRRSIKLLADWTI
jgi:hypothetical protein